jgi:hypothetical protein
MSLPELGGAVFREIIIRRRGRPEANGFTYAGVMPLYDVQAPRTSHRHYDLADMLIQLHVAMRLDDLLEREGSGDHRPQVAG